MILSYYAKMGLTVLFHTLLTGLILFSEYVITSTSPEGEALINQLLPFGLAEFFVMIATAVFANRVVYTPKDCVYLLGHIKVCCLHILAAIGLRMFIIAVLA